MTPGSGRPPARGECRQLVRAAFRSWVSYSETKDDRDLRLAVYRVKKALPGLPSRHWARKDGLRVMAEALEKLYEIESCSQCFTKARQFEIADDMIGIGREVLERTRRRNRRRGLWTSSLANWLWRRFECTGNREDLDEIIALRAGADAAMTRRHPDLLASFARALHARAVSGGPGKTDVGDLDQAVDVWRECVDASTGRQRAAAWEEFTVSLSTRAFHTRRVEDMDEAVSAGRRLLGTGAPDGDTAALRLQALGIQLWERYNVTGETADMDEAIDLYRTSLAAPGLTAQLRKQSEAELGDYLVKRFWIRQRTEDLDEGFDLQMRALPASHPDRLLERDVGRDAILAPSKAWAQFMNGMASLENFEIGELPSMEPDPRVLDAMLDSVAGLARSLPPEHPQLAEALLAEPVLLLAAARGRQGADLDEIIDKLRRLATRFSEDRVWRSKVVGIWSAAQLLRHERLGAERDLDEAIARLRSLLDDPALPAAVRLASGMEAGRRLAECERWNAAADVLEKAVDLLVPGTDRPLSRQAREHWLLQAEELGRFAAAVALQCGEPDRAALLSERGRGLLVSRALDHGADLSGVRAQAPELAAGFERVSLLVSADETSGDDAGTSRRQLRNELEEIVASIRELPGQHRFHTPIELADLRAPSADGPVVVLNTTQLRSDALIFSDGELDVLRFPDTTAADLAEQAGRLLGEIDASGNRWDSGDEDEQRATQQEIFEVLGWLWDTVTRPVLDRLGITGSPAGEEWPRIWWIPTGPFAFLPVHAAERDGHGALDRVVSSYVPTIKALSRARADTTSDDEHSVLTVAMPTTPSAGREIDPLPSAEPEASIVAEYAERHTTLTGEAATRDAVLAGLRRHSRVHFACHSMIDWWSPSESRLLIHDHEMNPLTVADIASLPFDRNGELAFLSACGTAKPDRRLVDEAVQLTTAFQMAGYRHVIGTRWQIRDPVPVTLADAFYRDLDRGVPHAAALHHAIRALRTRYRPFPVLWAAHIHSGP